MKKRILAFLTAITALTCLAFGACSKEETGDTPVSTEQSATSGGKEGSGAPAAGSPSRSEEEDPEFPDNDYGKDNEDSYPNAWN
ncbi:MAG: hypothetical protein IJ514_05355 [Clostridia bacterium]|nr:hypothetical protein [Clostridia bacterium]